MRNLSLQDSVGYRIKAAIARSGMSQADVANSASMRPQHLSDIILNKKHPAKTTLIRIARALDLPEDYFLESDSSSKPTETIVRKRIVFEYYLPDDLDLSPDETSLLRKRIDQFVHDTFNWINQLKKKA